LKNSTTASTGWGGWALTRVFGGGSGPSTKVAMGASGWACIWWSDGFVTGGKQCPTPAQRDELFAGWSEL